MAENYEDLILDIKNDDTFDMTAAETFGAKVALQWIDQNRDRAPGHTITESNLIAAVDETNHKDMNEYQKARALLVHLGHTIPAPNPEPTNAEKLEALILKEVRGNPQWDVSTIATAIDEAGAKAPGGDDESDDHV